MIKFLVMPGVLKVVPGVLQKKEININGVIVVLSSVQNVLKVKNNLGLNWAKLSSNWNKPLYYVDNCKISTTKYQ